MALTFTDTHNMIAFLTKSDASEGFKQIIDFLNAHVIQYALMDVEDVAEDEDDVNEVSTEPTPPSPTPATPPPPPQPEHIPSPPQAKTAQPSPSPQQQPSQTAKISMTLLNQLLETCATLTKQVVNLEQDKLKRLRKVGTAQRVKSSTDTVMDDQEDASKQGGIAKLDADEDVTLEEVDVEVTNDADVQGVTTATTTITAAPVPKASASRRKRGIIIQDPKEVATASVIVQLDVKSKDKGEKEIEEEGSKRKSESFEQKVAKKQRIDEEVEELKTHLHIVPNDEDDVYTEATPLALKVPVVEYQIHHEHNKPFYKIIRADGTYQLFLSFITLLRNFDREDLEML
uniref:Uncharacterized protein n=1 Tax=Tanacetum cinerariifolium TaxID=118510 RepID=A0A699IHG1_TANCI|nr:hypothetical protein [Tanacetum cinerariifolium]